MTIFNHNYNINKINNHNYNIQQNLIRPYMQARTHTESMTKDNHRKTASASMSPMSTRFGNQCTRTTTGFQPTDRDDGEDDLRNF